MHDGGNHGNDIEHDIAIIFIVKNIILVSTYITSHLKNWILLSDEVLDNIKDVRLVEGVDVDLILTFQCLAACSNPKEEEREKM